MRYLHLFILGLVYLTQTTGCSSPPPPKKSSATKATPKKDKGKSTSGDQKAKKQEGQGTQEGSGSIAAEGSTPSDQGSQSAMGQTQEMGGSEEYPADPMHENHGASEGSPGYEEMGDDPFNQLETIDTGSGSSLAAGSDGSACEPNPEAVPPLTCETTNTEDNTFHPVGGDDMAEADRKMCEESGGSIEKNAWSQGEQCVCKELMAFDATSKKCISTTVSVEWTLIPKDDWATSDTEFVNNFDKPLDFRCPPGEFIIGEKSRFSGDKNDRRFGFACSSLKINSLPAESADCVDVPGAETFLNKAKERSAINFTCSDGKFLVGQYSTHDNSAEDRNFRFRCCSIQVMDNGVSQKYVPSGCGLSQPTTLRKNNGFVASKGMIFAGYSSEWQSKDRVYQYRTCNLQKAEDKPLGQDEY